MTITTAVDVTAYGTIEAASFTQLVGFGTTTLHEDVTTTAPEGVNLSANQIVLDGLAIAADAVTDEAGTGQIKLAGTTGNMVYAGGVVSLVLPALLG